MSFCSNSSNAPNVMPERKIDVFVAGLPDQVNKHQLERLAEAYHPMRARVLYCVKNSKNRTGFVSFKTIADARNFINATDGTDPFNCGTTFVARFSDGKPGERKKLHFGKLRRDMTEDELFQMASEFGDVLCVKILDDQACGFVTFASQPDAENCMKHCNDRKYSVEFAKSSNRRVSQKRKSNKRGSAIDLKKDRFLKRSSGEHEQLSCGMSSSTRSSLASSGCGSPPMSPGMMSPDMHNLYQPQPMMMMVNMPVNSQQPLPPMTPVINQDGSMAKTDDIYKTTVFQSMEGSNVHIDEYGNVITTFTQAPMPILNAMPLQTPFVMYQC